MQSKPGSNKMANVENINRTRLTNPDENTEKVENIFNVEVMLNKDQKSEKRRILKNIILISVAWLLVFTAFQGLQRLQSSLHRTEGMGVTNLSVVYAALVLSCLFLPKLLISFIGHKWTISLSFSGYILWMAANGYATWWTMIPASICLGICAAPLWTAQCSYFTILARRYAQLGNDEEEVVVTRFFGIFFMFFQMSGISGSIITSTILKPVNTNSANNDSLSAEEAQQFCGLNDCPWNNVTQNENFAQPSSDTVWTMLGIFIAITALAVILVVFLVDQLPSNLRDDPKKAKKEALTSLTLTIRHLRQKKQWCIILITMYSGFEQVFYAAEWTSSFVSCSLGIWKVGLVTLGFGVANSAMSICGGHVVKYTGRIPIMTLGMVIDTIIQVTLIIWPLDMNKEYLFYILSAMWGLSDGIWQSQINALYGSIFTNTEAAFSNYRLWESSGFIIAFAYSSFLCTNIKLYVLMFVLFTGMIGYYLAEWLHIVEKRVSQNAKY